MFLFIVNKNLVKVSFKSRKRESRPFHSSVHFDQMTWPFVSPNWLHFVDSGSNCHAKKWLIRQLFLTSYRT